jgi:uncharacterized protein DUF1573
MSTSGRVVGGLLAAVAVAVAVLAARGAFSPARIDPGPPGRPQIEVEPRAVDFGDVLPGKTLSQELSVRNHGDGELRITDVAKTCDCTIVGSYDTVLAPGAGTRIRVSLNTPSAPGRTAQAVRIESNDPDQPRIEVPVTATVIAAPAGGISPR